MSEPTTDECQFDARGTMKVKRDSQYTHRLTPPKEVRQQVGMEADEPWSWFYHPDSGRVFIRRSGASLDGIPDDCVSVGVAESRQNGRYLDFAIPKGVIDAAEMQAGEWWEFRVLDRNTMSVTRESGDDQPTE